MGCGASSPAGGGTAPEPPLPALPGDLVAMLETAGLADNAELRAALKRHGCTMGVFKKLRDAGKLEQAIAEYGLGTTLGARLEEAVRAALGSGEGAGKVPGAFQRSATAKAVKAAGDAAEALQGGVVDRAAAVGEGAEENAALLDAGLDVLQALGAQLGLEGVGAAVGDFVGVAQGALEVLGAVPFVAPVARLAALVVQQVAAEKGTRALCKGLIPLCTCAVKVLREAGPRLEECEAEVGALREALEEAVKLVEEVRDRSFLRRLLTARGDADGVKEAGEKVENALRLVVANAAVQALGRADQALEEARGVTGGLRSGAEMRALLGAVGGEGASEDEVLRRVGGLGADEWEEMWGKFSAGEKVAIAKAKEADRKADEAHRRIDGVQAAQELLMEQLVNKMPPEVENLAPRLREMWADEDMLDLKNDVEAQWSDVEEMLPAVPCFGDGEPLEKWAEQGLPRGKGSFPAFLAGPVKSALAPGGDVCGVKTLHALASKARLRARVRKADVGPEHVLDYVRDRAGAGRGGLAQARWRRALMAARLGGGRSGAGDAGGGGVSGEEGEKAGGAEGAARTLRALLEPHDFSADCATRAAGFMPGTRAWLTEKIMAWARGEGEDGGRRVFALMSLPGMGKTAFTARVSEELADEEMLLAGHFVRVGDDTRTDPRRVLGSLAAQVAERLGGEVADAVREGAAAGEEEGTVWDAAERLLVKPLSRRNGGGEGKPLVVVVDALDEGGGETSNVLLSVLSRLIGALPAWVKVLVTTRPEEYIRRALARHEPFTLEPTDEQNKEDLRAFIRGSLSRELDEGVRAEAMAAIEDKSEGVIGYVAAVMAMVREGMRDGSGLARAKVGELPVGLRALYAGYLERQFGGLGEAEKRAVTERMLPALVVAEEPLSVAELKRLVRLGGDAELDDGVVARAVGSKGSLFPTGEDGLVRPFHKSVLDWLGDEKGSGEWYVAAATGHRVHARTWRRAAEGVEGEAGHGRCAEALGEYGAAFALHHVAGSGDRDAAVAMCTNLELLRAGVEAGAVKRLIVGVGRCRAALARGGETGGGQGDAGDTDEAAGRVLETLRWLRCVPSMRVWLAPWGDTCVPRVHSSMEGPMHDVVPPSSLRAGTLGV